MRVRETRGDRLGRRAGRHVPDEIEHAELVRIAEHGTRQPRLYRLVDDQMDDRL